MRPAISDRVNRLRAAFAAVAFAVASLHGAAHAVGSEAGNPHLGAAMEHIERGDLDAAREALDEAMAHPENTNRELVEIYATLAVVHLYAGSENLAYEAYVRLLNIDPGYELPAHTARPLRDLFERVARAYEEGHLRAVRVAHEPPTQVPAGTPPLITTTISNLPPAFSAYVRFREEGEAGFTSIGLRPRPGNRWAAALPPVDPRELEDGETALEYYLEVVNEAGHRVQGSGNAREPHRLRIVSALVPDEPETRDSAWYQRPWVWGVVGGVAAGTATAVYLSTRPSGEGTLPVRVRIREEL